MIEPADLTSKRGCEYLYYASNAAETTLLTVQVEPSVGDTIAAGSQQTTLDNADWSGIIEQGEFLTTAVCDDQMSENGTRTVDSSTIVTGTLIIDPLPDDFEPCSEYEHHATLDEAEMIADDGTTTSLGSIQFTTFFWSCNVAG